MKYTYHGDGKPCSCNDSKGTCFLQGTSVLCFMQLESVYISKEKKEVITEYILPPGSEMQKHSFAHR